MKHLNDDELIRLADVLEIPHIAIQKIAAAGILNEKEALYHIIRSDYLRARRLKKYLPTQIKAAIQMKYHVNAETIKKALTRSTLNKLYCKQCGKETKRYVLKRNNGLCDECSAVNVEL